jgi:hypothetical protein
MVRRFPEREYVVVVVSLEDTTALAAWKCDRFSHWLDCLVARLQNMQNKHGRVATARVFAFQFLVARSFVYTKCLDVSQVSKIQP